MARNLGNAPSKQKAGRKNRRDAMPGVGFRHPSEISFITDLKKPSRIVYIGSLMEIRDLPKEIIIITPDILQYHLDKYSKMLARRRPILMPLTLVLMFLLALVTSKFQDTLGIPGSTWHAVCIIGFVLSVCWLGYSVLDRVWAETHSVNIISSIENESMQTGKAGLLTIQKPRDEKEE